jgi:hypothetical protein
MHRKTESEQTRNRPDDKDVKYAAGRRREREKMKRKEEKRGEKRDRSRPGKKTAGVRGRIGKRLQASADALPPISLPHHARSCRLNTVIRYCLPPLSLIGLSAGNFTPAIHLRALGRKSPDTY